MHQADPYDYIVIGAGSAGCVLANRLSADPAVRVCLIEAGPSDRRFPVNLKSRVPVGGIFFRQDRRYNWLFQSRSTGDPQGAMIPCPRGRLFGGTSSINGMVYMRGQPQDYDRWAALGNPGWSFADVLPYFRKSEHFEDGDDPLHGQGGELNVAAQRSPHPLTRAFIEAALQCQYRRNDDFNGAQQEGFGLFHVTQKNGERWSSARAFLHPVLNRPNLDVLADATVVRIAFDGRRAGGVVLRRDGREFEIRTRREVILAAGAIGSPQLLLLSGIGPAPHLRDHGIEVVADSPGVGRNLQDHCDVALIMADRSRTSYALSPSGLRQLMMAPLHYLRKRGPMSSIMVEGGGFVRSSPELKRPDLHFIFIPLLHNRAEYLPRRHGFIIHVSLLRPKSRGFLQLASADPGAAPLIHHNMLSDADDLRLLVEGMRIARRIASAPALARHAAGELAPGADVQTDEEISAFVRGSVATIFHPVGTCRMGADGDAVVDARLRVRGVAALRVVDASIMPELVSGNTNAPTIMIGERGADLIKADAAA